VTVSFTAGRTGQPWASSVYWAGQVTAFAAVVLPAFGRRTSARAVQGLVLAYAAAQSLFAYAYSPVMFRFPDELQHWRTADSILASDHLFAPNYSLPVSPEFPGLEVAAMFGVKVFGLTLYESGRIVASLAHLLLAAMVLVLTTRMLRSRRAAALATLFVLVSPSNLVFHTLFLYGAVALPFLWLAVHEALAPPGRGVRGPATLACAALAVCTVTHHLTMVLGLGGMWVLVGYGALRRPDRTLLVRWTVIAVVSTSIAVAWILWRAPEVLGYLGAPFQDFVERFTSSGPRPVPLTPDPPPLPDRLLSLAAIALSAVLVPIGVVVFVRRRRDRLSRLFVTGALLLYPALALRAVPGAGAELSTRMLAYCAVLSAPAMVVALTAWYRSPGLPARVSSTMQSTGTVRRKRWLRVCAPVAAVVFFAGNVATGWPPFWERVPGRSYVDGYESGITGSSLLLSSWAAGNLRNGDRVGCDFTACSVLSAYSGIDPVNNPARAVFAPRLDAAVIEDARRQWYGYLVIDRRIGTDPTPTGSYYRHATDQDAPKGPVPPGSLEKFETAGEIQKIYDDGTYVVYDLRGLLR
jgi:hypothetical protein